MLRVDENNEEKNDKVHQEDFHLFGLTIERKINIPSIVTLILAVWGIMAQSYLWLSGPRLSVIQRSPITFYSKIFSTDNPQPLVYAVMNATFQNNGSKGYDLAIMHSELQLTGRRTWKYEWQDFVSTGSREPSEDQTYPCLAGETCVHGLYVRKTGDATPTLITSGSIVTLETLFLPVIPACASGNALCYHSNFIYESDFLLIMMSGSIKVTFTLDATNGQRVSEICTITFNADIVRAFQRNGWINVPCT